jgi:uncharacterized protein YecE (DUF72 family)
MSLPEWHIGCSGFYYPEWKNLFYPAGLARKNWFEYYCTHFNTLELNVTFYRFPELSSLKNWYDKSSAGFTFSVKAPRTITHYQQFQETEQIVDDFYGVISDGLKEKLGPVLFQLPGKISFTEERLQKMVTSLKKGFTNVIEFRHESWWNAHVYDTLAAHSIVFCSPSFPRLPDMVIRNTDIVYYRFHGVPQLYKSEYHPEKIQQVTSEIIRPGNIRIAYLYFNNTMGMAGINNARHALDLTGSI